MKRTGFLVYGLVSYAIFFGTFLYLCGFMSNFLVPKSIDGPVDAASILEAGKGLPAWIVNVVLLAFFALPHSIMARPAFKNWWTKIVPKQIERSTYVLQSSLMLVLMMWLWKPMPGTIFTITDTPWREAMFALFAIGWLLVLVSTFLIDHFELFGLTQVWLQFKGKEPRPYTFKTPLIYKWVRHPIYLGWMIAFWATPDFTQGHLLFAFITTLYMIIAIIYEERDLSMYYGDEYRSYMSRVSMLIPVPPKKD